MENQSKLISWIALFCSILIPVATVVYNAKENARLEESVLLKNAEIASAHDAYKVREDYITKIEVLSEVFAAEFTLFSRVLMDQNKVPEDIRAKLLSNLQKQTLEIFDLKATLQDYPEKIELIHVVQTKINNTREALITIYDAGQLGDVYKGIGSMYEGTTNLKVAIRDIPLIPQTENL